MVLFLFSIFNLKFDFSFIVSFSFYTANPENDGKKVQEFFLTMEAAIRDHSLWDNSTNEEIDTAMEVICELMNCCISFLMKFSFFIYVV